jgi:phage terminase large subunit-like protein
MGGHVGRVAALLGTPLMPWQQAVADVALEVDERTGRLFYRVVVITTMRQVGKTTLLLPVWVQRCLQWPHQRVSWTMQTAKDAREKWEQEHVPQLEACRQVRAAILPGARGIRRANGSEHVRFRNGSMQTLMATSLASGHGKVLDLGIVDEAMAQSDDRLWQAMKPAMKTRNQDGMPGSQIWLVSTVGTPESEWFHGWVDAGRRAVEQGSCETDRVCFVEYSAPEDADPGDPDTWRAAIPALGFTITEDTIAEEYQQALLTPDGLSGFRRQALNQRTASRSDPPIPLVLWDACADPQASRPTSGLVWAVDVSPDQASASIAVAGRRLDGAAQVEVVDQRPGVGWVEERAGELRRRHGGRWRVDRRGPAASLGVVWAESVSGPDALAACAGLELAVREGRMRHTGQAELRVALDGAEKAAAGDGGWRWSRKNSGADISPLVAAGLALDGVLTAPVTDPLLAVW